MDDVQVVKQKIENRLNVSTELQRLTFGTVTLDDKDNIFGGHVRPGDTIHLHTKNEGLRGGVTKEVVLNVHTIERSPVLYNIKVLEDANMEDVLGVLRNLVENATLISLQLNGQDLQKMDRVRDLGEEDYDKIGVVVKESTLANPRLQQFVILDELGNHFPLSDNRCDEPNNNQNDYITSSISSWRPWCPLSTTARHRLNTRIQAWNFRDIKHNIALFEVRDDGVYCVFCRDTHLTHHTKYATEPGNCRFIRNLRIHCLSDHHIRNRHAYFQKYPNTPTYKHGSPCCFAPLILPTLLREKEVTFTYTPPKEGDEEEEEGEKDRRKAQIGVVVGEGDEDGRNEIEEKEEGEGEGEGNEEAEDTGAEEKEDKVNTEVEERHEKEEERRGRKRKKKDEK